MDVSGKIQPLTRLEKIRIDAAIWFARHIACVPIVVEINRMYRRDPVISRTEPS